MQDTQYEQLLDTVIREGSHKSDRTGTGTVSLFGTRLRYNLAAGFPLVTTKQVNFDAVKLELLWFLRGDTNVTWLKDRGVGIWNQWADPAGDLGPTYGRQWRSWPTSDGGHIDQITRVLDTIRTDPNSRRMVVSAWNVAELDKMRLPPCHIVFQFSVAEGRLSVQVYQRSADLFLGVPFNIASYALLTHMVAQQSGLLPGELIWVGGDTHIYRSHLTQVMTQLKRPAFDMPTLILKNAPSLFDYQAADITMHEYECHPPLRGIVAV
ncbi:MAG: thymidylate synthase [Mycobacterium sp.]